jgi:hypothetical protein
MYYNTRGFFTHNNLGSTAPVSPQLLNMSDPDDTNSSRDSTPQAHFHTPDSSPPPPAPLRPAPINNILKISKSKGPHVLMKDYGRVEGDYFQTFEDSFNALGVAYWRPPINDLTIPRTPEQDRAIVRVVVEAFKDMTYALDTPDNAYRKRFTPGTNVCYAGWTIEACAWMVVVSLTGLEHEMMVTDML